MVFGADIFGGKIVEYFLILSFIKFILSTFLNKVLCKMFRLRNVFDMWFSIWENWIIRILSLLLLQKMIYRYISRYGFCFTYMLHKVTNQNFIRVLNFWPENVRKKLRIEFNRVELEQNWNLNKNLVLFYYGNTRKYNFSIRLNYSTWHF